MLNLPGLKSYTITESTGKTEDIISVVLSGIQKDFLIQQRIELNDYDVLVRDMYISRSNGQLDTNIIFGTQRILLNTVIPAGIAKFNDNSFATVISQLFDAIGIETKNNDINTQTKVPATAIDGKEEVLAFLKKITKVKNAETVKWWFDLYNEFHAYDVDYEGKIVEINQRDTKINNINSSHRHFYTKQEIQASADFNKPDEEMKTIPGTAFITTEASPSKKNKDDNKIKKGYGVGWKPKNIPIPNFGSPEIPSTLYQKQYVEGTTVKITMSGEVDTTPMSRIKLSGGSAYNGSYTLDYKTTTYNPDGSIITVLELTTPNKVIK